MIEHPAPQNRGVRTSNHDRSLGSKRWLGRTEFLTRTIQSEPRLETRKPTDRAKWRSSLSAYRSVLENCLTAADIVRDADFATTTEGSAVILTRMRNMRVLLYLFLPLTFFVSSTSSIGQTVPARDQWGEKFNSTGATLTYKEVGRTRTQGRTVITYNLFASGLPKDQHY